LILEVCPRKKGGVQFKSVKPNILAIDFGTSNSLVAAANENQIFDPIPLDPFASDPTIFRSLLYFPDAQKAYYGAEAIQKFVGNEFEGRLIRSIKKQLPLKSFIGTWIGDRPMNLEDLIALFLKEMRLRACKFFDCEIDRAVIGRPAKFSLDEAADRFGEFRLLEAAKRAGFKSVIFCPEPLAAAYDYQEQITEVKKVLVADFGGGTSDFTVIRIGKKHFEPSDVLAIGGVPVAGDALDGYVMRKEVSPFFGGDVEYQVPFSSNILRMPAHLMSLISSPADISFLGIQDAKEFLLQLRSWTLSNKDKEKMDRLLILIEDKVGFQIFERIEAAKKELSKKNESIIKVDYPKLELAQPITKVQFDTACKTPIHSILEALDKTVALAGLEFKDIDLVCCTGGTAYVPAINEGILARFGKDKLRQHQNFHSVVKGLALKAQEVVRGK
jgi:hypothetical chaperone protein